MLFSIKPAVLFLRNIPYKTRRKKDIYSLNDEELILEYRKNQQNEIIGILFDRYIHLVFAGCMKYLKDEDKAQDAAMELFESLPEKLLKYEISSFKSWLYMTSKNHCLMILRRNKNADHFEKIENLKEFSVEFVDPLHHNNMDADVLIRQHLAKLKDDQRLCLELMYLKGLSYKAIEEKTGLDLKKIKSHIQNGKRNLRMSLEKYYEQEK